MDTQQSIDHAVFESLSTNEHVYTLFSKYLAVELDEQHDPRDVVVCKVFVIASINTHLETSAADRVRMNICISHSLSLIVEWIRQWLDAIYELASA